jgi:hypothetical protein
MRRRRTGDEGSFAGRLLFLALLAGAGVAAVYWTRPEILFTETVSVERAKESSDSPQPALIDPEVDHTDIDAFACGERGGRGMSAVIDLTNRGEERASYRATVVFESPSGDRQVGTGSISVSHLEPGQVVTDEALAFESGPAGGFRCRVIEFTRFPP